MNALKTSLIAVAATLAGAAVQAETTAPTALADAFVVENEAYIPQLELEGVTPETLLVDLPSAEEVDAAPAIPEPVGVAMLAAGMGAMMLMRRRLG